MSFTHRRCAMVIIAMVAFAVLSAQSAHAAIYSGMMHSNLKLLGYFPDGPPPPPGAPLIPGFIEIGVSGFAVFDPFAEATGAAVAAFGGDATVLAADPFDIMPDDSLDYLGLISGSATAPPDSESSAFAVGLTDLVFENVSAAPITFGVRFLLDFDFDISASVAAAGEDAFIDAFLFVDAFGPDSFTSLFELEVFADALLGPPSVSGAETLELDVLFSLEPGDSAFVLMDAGLDGFASAEGQHAVPEPTALLTWTLLGLGGVGLAVVRRRRKR